MTFSLAAHVAAREAMELFVDEWIQLVECGLIPIAPLGEQLRDLMLLRFVRQLGETATYASNWVISPGLRSILFTSPTWSSSSAIIRRA